MTKVTKLVIIEPMQPPTEPEEGELQDEELETVRGGNKGLLCTTITNLANMKHEMLKAVANNLRA